MSLTDGIKKKKLTKADFLRVWKVPFTSRDWNRLRYKNPPEKGIYWYYFSLFIRQRDVEKYGTCISCGRSITVETSDAGHFMPAENCGRDLLFDFTNVNAECSHCNAWDGAHLLGYADGLDARYGQGTAKWLRERRDVYRMRTEVVKDWKAAEYARLICALPNFNGATL